MLWNTKKCQYICAGNDASEVCKPKSMFVSKPFQVER